MPYLTCQAKLSGHTDTYLPRRSGFWGGLWHGMIAPITFLVSLFANGVSIYEANNNERWYEFGFLLGIAAYAVHFTQNPPGPGQCSEIA